MYRIRLYNIHSIYCYFHNCYEKKTRQSVTNQVGACLNVINVSVQDAIISTMIHCTDIRQTERWREWTNGERVREFCESCAYYHADHHDDGHHEGPRRSGQKIAQLCKNVNCDAEWRSGEFRVRRNQLEVKETL